MEGGLVITFHTFGKLLQGPLSLRLFRHHGVLFVILLSLARDVGDLIGGDNFVGLANTTSAPIPILGALRLSVTPALTPASNLLFARGFA